MWARICELLLGIWLLYSHFLFDYKGKVDLVSTFFILLFASLCFIKRLQKMHLLQIIPASLLFYVSYTYPVVPLPFSLQNFILVGLSLLLFAVIPSHASDHPEPWKKFLNNHSKER
jgi:hypothetical protein